MIVLVSALMILFVLASNASGAYAGPEACKTCHMEKYEQWKNSLHAKAIVNASDAIAAGYPIPDGVNKDDLKYTWAGKWKVRWVNKSGYVITGDAAQYNVVEKKFVPYEAGQTQGYTCGPCHTTGYDKNGTMFQGANAFKSGTWKIPGVTCERCHGEGSEHVKAPAKANIKIDRTAEACDDCHGRTDASIKVTKTDLDPKRRHRVQYNDFYQSVMYKGGKSCINCHNSHDTTDALYVDLGKKFDADALANMKPTKIMYYKGNDNNQLTNDYEIPPVPICAMCHVRESALYPNTPKVKLEHGNAKCIDCHMAKSRKTATAWDERTHTLKIDDKFNYSMAKPYMNYPDLTCKQCHADMDFS
ncbi:MAG: multiheme c-type cytochrome, partial [Candidatus Methanoperedens sp.]|nr:multiheme c-type cytochrome [Candidatus Methanoperedens sp.]